MNFGNQIVTIAAVVIGALTTYLVTALGDRARERREMGRQWVDRKLANYASYTNDVKNLVTVARQLAALNSLHDAAPGIAEDRAQSMLDEAEVRRSASYENVKLLADASTLRATRALNDAVHRLEWIAAGRFEQAGADDWSQSWQLYQEAADEFRGSVRRELGVPGELLPHGAWVRPSLPAPADPGA